jgi:hypothetical protein
MVKAGSKSTASKGKKKMSVKKSTVRDLDAKGTVKGGQLPCSLSAKTRCHRD